MKGPRNLVIHASAGTGKTYQLTSRYLALLLDGADPGAVLATTFTRKAAHEILDRVLARLACAASEGKASEGERARLSTALGRDVSAAECLVLLERLLRSMDRLRIGTIDAFFAQLARLFALDLGLPAEWRIVDEVEAESLRSEAVSDAVAKTGRLEFLELLTDLQKQSVGRSVHEELLTFTRKGRDVLLGSTREAWEKIEALPDVAKEELDRALAALPEMTLPRTKSGKNAGCDNVHWTGAKAKLIDLTARVDWPGVLEQTLIRNVIGGKSTYDRCPIDRGQHAVLKPIANHALHVATRRIAIQNKASRSLLEQFEESYRSRSSDSGWLAFQDLPEALAPASRVFSISPETSGAADPSSPGWAGGGGWADADRSSAAAPRPGPRADLAHRLDGRIDHLLLDEFQDTAPAQWRILRPLADSIVADSSGARSFFCVGDEKQSIYGWRDAEPRLLRDLAANRKGLEPAELHDSYRSSRAVLGAVNAVFGSLADNRAFEDRDPEIVEAALELQRSFREHVPVRERSGAAHLVRARAASGGEPDHQPVLELVVRRVQEILRDAPGASVGVLLRSRNWISELIHRFRKEGIPASDEGGNPLTDSSAVLHALSLLLLADHPGASAAAFHVASSRLGAKVGLDLASYRERAGPVARETRSVISTRGFGAFLASIAPTEGEGYGGWDLQRFGQLVELALAWESRTALRPAAFVERVRTTKVEDPSAARVRVMTVHAAKGLEFDAVLLPELDAPITKGQLPLLTLRPDPEGPIQIVSHGLAKELSPAHAELERVRADVVRRRTLEELCVLYVAMTRAVHRLDLIVRGRDKESDRLSSAAILRAALRVSESASEAVAWEHPAGTQPWFREEIARSGGAETVRETEGRRLLRLAPSRRTRSLPAWSPSQAKSMGPLSAAKLLLPIDAITVRGRLVHRMLAEVEWIETFDRSDEDLLAVGREIESDESLLAAALAEFRTILGRPEARRLLSRPAEAAESWREREFAVVLPGPDGSDTLCSGAFDRVVLRRAGEKATSAEIVDFKTDRVAGDALRTRAQEYAPQMEAYRRALARMTGLPSAAIRARLAFLGADSVVEV